MPGEAVKVGPQRSATKIDPRASFFAIIFKHRKPSIFPLPGMEEVLESYVKTSRQKTDPPLTASKESRILRKRRVLRYLSCGWSFAIVVGILAGSSHAFLPNLAEQGSTGSIAGRVMDPSQTLVPGVTIKAIRQEDGKAAQAVSDEAGSYVLESLMPGSYILTAELSGFKTATHGPMVVTAGGRLLVDFQMRLAAADHAHNITESYSTLAGLFGRSDYVAYLRIDHVDPAVEWEMGANSSVMGVLVGARVLEQFKNHAAHGSSTGQLLFLHFGSSSPYKAGQQFVSFFIWDPNVKHLVELAGDVHTIEIRDSRVTKTTALKGVRVDMPAAGLLKQLRSLAKSHDRNR